MNLWPFKKRQNISLEEWAATKSAAPCGYQKEHYFWTEIEGWTCPKCAGIKKRKEREEEEDRMADKIAAAVIRRMNGDIK